MIKILYILYPDSQDAIIHVRNMNMSLHVYTQV